MKIFFRQREIEVAVREVGIFSKWRGLMFKRRSTSNLLFDFKQLGKHTIHSYFVFFPFLALWLDSANKIVAWQIVHPFTILVKSPKVCRKLVEIPLHKRYHDILSFFVGEQKI